MISTLARGAYTDTAHATKAKITIPYSDEIMNHDYIGSLGCIPNEPKSRQRFFDNCTVPESYCPVHFQDLSAT